MSQLDYKPKNCHNCGHPQHCGSSYWLEIKELQEKDKDPYVVEACKKCACPDCVSNTDIPKSMLNGL